VAYHAGAPEAFRILLAAHANPHLMDKRGRTVLVLAATSGDLAIVSQLLSSGVTRRSWRSRRHAALAATARGRVEVALKLLVAGAKVDTMDARASPRCRWPLRSTMPPLPRCCSPAAPPCARRTSAVRRPCGARRAPEPPMWHHCCCRGRGNRRTGPEGLTPLMSASAAGQDKLVALLLEAHARPDLKSAPGTLR